ncbi:MAG: response regulator transcription factor [Pseudomonadota bacterium]
MRNMLIVEDHPLVAEATKALFMTMAVGHIEICRNAEEAVALLQARDDWYRLWLDVGLPGTDGLSLVRYVHKLGWAERAAVITASDNLQWRVDVQAMGFLGYVLKTASVEEFSFALKEILEGRPYFDKQPHDRQPTHLTQRQTEILCLLHDGLCTKDIARRLKLSPGTVDNHISALISALRANDRTHAVAIGMKCGYVRQHDTRLMELP